MSAFTPACHLAASVCFRPIADISSHDIARVAEAWNNSTMIKASLFLSAVAFAIQPVLAAPAEIAGPNRHEVQFRNGDHEAQLIARKLLGKENLQQGDLLRTAWVNMSEGGGPALFVMFGCSPTGNCELNGFERARTGYRLVLDSLAQRCWILRSSHAGHRDLLAYTHGAAFEGTRKIYWWRGGRYVRVSESVARSGD